MIIKLGLVKKEPKCILSTLALTMLIYTGVHICNEWINDYCRLHDVVNASGDLIRVNYMFSVNPANPLLALFYRFVPYKYWYMYLVVPIVAGYLVVIYAPQLYAGYHEKRGVRTAAHKIVH